MRKIYAYGRKVRVPLDDKGFNSNEYSHFVSVEYGPEDLENETIIDSVEFKELEKEIDKIQRRIIEEETGITELPMDISKRRIKLKTRIKNDNKNTSSSLERIRTNRKNLQMEEEDE
jgi:hypothetical protein